MGFEMMLQLTKINGRCQLIQEQTGLPVVIPQIDSLSLASNVLSFLDEVIVKRRWRRLKPGMFWKIQVTATNKYSHAKTVHVIYLDRRASDFSLSWEQLPSPPTPSPN